MDEPRTVSEGNLFKMHKALVDFGYLDLTSDDVRASADRIMAGEKAINVIDMFVEGFIKDAGLLPERTVVDANRDS